MKQTIAKSIFPSAMALELSLVPCQHFLVAPGMAWAINEVTSLTRGAEVDTTAQQRY